MMIGTLFVELHGFFKNLSWSETSRNFKFFYHFIFGSSIGVTEKKETIDQIGVCLSEHNTPIKI